MIKHWRKITRNFLFYRIYIIHDLSGGKDNVNFRVDNICMHIISHIDLINFLRVYSIRGLYNY